MRRLTSLLTTGVIFAVLVLHTSGIAMAGHGSEPDGDSETVAGLVAAVAEANQQVADIGADIQHQQESVNRALVELATAREAVTEAHRTLADSEKALADSQTAIDATQQRFDEFAASTYMNGPSRSLPLASSPEDILSAASTQQTHLLAFGRVKDDLRRSQTERANRLSAAKQARLDADAAAAEAQRRQDAAVTELVAAQRAFTDQQSDLTRLAAERDSAQTRLTTARPVAATAHQPTAAQPGAAVPPSGQWDRSSPAPADSSRAGQWDTTLPMVPSANVAGDPIAIINAVLKIMATSLQLTADMGRNFLVKLGILSPATAAADPGITNGRIPRLYGRQASEFEPCRNSAFPTPGAAATPTGPLGESIREPTPSASTALASCSTPSQAWASNSTTTPGLSTTPAAKCRHRRCSAAISSSTAPTPASTKPCTSATA